MTIQAALDQAISSRKITGAVAMTVNKAGVTAAHVAGLRDPSGDSAMTLDTVFQLASMTKAITSVAAMQLVEHGDLSLDAPLADLLPELANPQVITGFDADRKVQIRPAKRAVTLRHVLTHTSGFGYEFMSQTMVDARGPGGSPPPGTKAALLSPLLFDPGERWEYGISTDWVGLAVEAASGKRLDAYFDEAILGPLGMADTGFFVNEAQASRRAALQLRGEDGSFVPFPVEIGGGPDVEILSAGGGLYGTGPDYMRFLRMILNGGTLDGTKILKPETVIDMARNQIGTIRAGGMESINPMFAIANDPFPDQHSGWGLGFLINPETGPNGRAAGSLAWAGIANTYYWIDPANDVAGLILMQFLPFGDPAALELYGSFERAVYATS
jgi:CubicO group peptidase (beta-lactamase class C family)